MVNMCYDTMLTTRALWSNVDLRKLFYLSFTWTGKFIQAFLVYPYPVHRQAATLGGPLQCSGLSLFGYLLQCPMLSLVLFDEAYSRCSYLS
jgi:hypothetical protein